MLSYFPARDVEEPVTKEFLRAELVERIGALDVKMERQLRSMQAWTFGTVVTANGILFAALKLAG